ncbi:anthranilate synthase component II [Lacunimicrobium album]
MSDVLLIDNYDSFVFNLARYVRELGRGVVVARNDAISVGEIVASRFSSIIISPGPCTPNEAGVSLEVIRQLSGVAPMLGICLGHQAIGQAFGGNVVRDEQPMHGMASVVEHDGTKLFEGIEKTFEAGRYHSLVVEESTLPECLKVTARTQDERRVIMGLQHVEHPTFGVQFHPESILTGCGHALLGNFLRIAEEFHHTRKSG